MPSPKIPLMCSGSGGTGSDTYHPLLNCQGSNTSVEFNAETPFFEDGTLSNAYINVWSNASGSPVNVKSRKNGADGNMLITIGTGGTGRYFDNTNTDDLTAGDYACMFIDRVGASMQAGVIGAYYSTDSGNIVNKIGVFGSAAETSNTRIWGMLGGFDAVSEIKNFQPDIIVDATAKNLHYTLSNNSRTSTTTLRTRKNNANGGLSLTIPTTAGAIRATQTSGSDSLTAGDTFNYRKVPGGGTGTNTFSLVGCELHYGNSETQFFSADMGGVLFSATTARFIVLMGAYLANGSEQPANVRLYGSGTISDFACRVSASTATANATVGIRKNNVSTAINITTTAGAAGQTYTDSVNTFDFVDNDYINGRYLKSTGTGGDTFRWFTYKVTYDVEENDSYPQTIFMG